MDLFTVDTVGEQNLLDQDEYNGSEILYSNTKSAESKNIAGQSKEEKSDEEANVDNENDDNEVVEKNYDYGG